MIIITSRTLCCQVQGPRQISVHTQKKKPRTQNFFCISPIPWCCQVQVAGQVFVHVQKTPHPTLPHLEENRSVFARPCLSRLCKSFYFCMCHAADLCSVNLCIYKPCLHKHPDNIGPTLFHRSTISVMQVTGAIL